MHVGDTSRGTPVWIDKHVADADKVIITGGITVPVSYTHLDVYKRQPLPVSEIRSML